MGFPWPPASQQEAGHEAEHRRRQPALARGAAAAARREEAHALSALHAARARLGIVGLAGLRADLLVRGAAAQKALAERVEGAVLAELADGRIPEAAAVLAALL